MLVVNFASGPGAGKTTLASGLFFMLKTPGFNVEIITEYSKELIISGDHDKLSDELLVFTEKYRRLQMMRKVDIVISDSPLLNSCVYSNNQFGDSGQKFFLDVALSFDSVYILIDRHVSYVPDLREPLEENATRYTDAIHNLVESCGSPFIRIPGLTSRLDQIKTFVVEQASARGIYPRYPESPG